MPPRRRDDESVADFTLRHFGPEVLDRVAAPLLSGVFGGDVRRLSVRAVMPAFVEMERQHGSLIAALQSQYAAREPQPIFTTLRSGLGTLADRLTAAIPAHWIRRGTRVTAARANAAATDSPPWTVHTASTGKHYGSETFDSVLLATPLDITRSLLAPLDQDAANLLPAESSSAVLVAFAYADAGQFPVPPGFGFLVPPRNANPDHAKRSAREHAAGLHLRESEIPEPRSAGRPAGPRFFRRNCRRTHRGLQQ